MRLPATKGWKSCFFFISYHRGWSFLTEWTSRTVSNSIPVLSTDEIGQVEILRGILSISRGVKDMNEAWLAEVGLSPAPGDMFNLNKMKSDGEAGSRSAAPLAASAPGVGDAEVSTVEKRPNSGAGAGLRKRLRKVTAEQLADALRSTARTSADKGKGTVELEEVPERWYTMRELCEVEDRAMVDTYFASIMTWLKCADNEDPLMMRWLIISGSSPFWTEGLLFGEYLLGVLHPALTKQVHECSSKELMNRVGKLVVWSQHQKILTLWAVNKELKAGVSQELVAIAGRWAKELEGKVEKMQTELESLRSQRRELEQEVGLLRSSLDGARNDRARLEGDVLSLNEAVVFLEVELKAEGQKAMVAYKASRGFESGLEKMGRVSYEFGYRVALERLWGKHPI
ncbi:hypothetical protein B296_00002241 [Ensete ventricosum]|uniref:Uncharacterized protein n=1 Tax=Ensete ventricosum TaxID=4639 RepID=A0A427B8S2_ENSVE|nr:hypothetical protein B296_00002241 [Ensete ventricosum]